MAVEAVNEFMGELYDDAEELGSGKYTRYSKHLQSINEQIEGVKDQARYAMAAEMLVAHPGSVNTAPVYKHTRKQEFMREVVMLKCAELSTSVVAHDKRLTAAMATAWKRALVAEFLDEESAVAEPAGYTKLRHGIASLFTMRSGMLDHIVCRLDELVVDPRSLFPEVWGDATQPGDLGGPTAAELIRWEPRFLRWIMYLPPDGPWPYRPEMYPTGCRSPEHPMHELVTQAMQWGGDDPTINDPCTCAKCGGVGLPRDRRKGKRLPTWEREYYALARALGDDTLGDDTIEGRYPKGEGAEEEQQEDQEEPCRKRVREIIRVFQKPNGLWVRERHFENESGFAVGVQEECDLPPPAPRRAHTA